MAKSKYEYVKNFEQCVIALPQTFIVVRVDGRGFTKMCKTLKFKKPNDLRALNLMNHAAVKVMEEFEGIFLAYGQSDEYSFVFSLEDNTFDRRIDKITSCLVSLFTSAYVLNFCREFGSLDLLDGLVPSFDSRLVCYPNSRVLRDYFSWRQVDCHINNLYNYCFWLLVNGRLETNRYGISDEELIKVKKLDAQFGEINEEEKQDFQQKDQIEEGNEFLLQDAKQGFNFEGTQFKRQVKLDNKAAEQRLKGTVSSEKIELLWEDYGISYGKDVLAIERKGSVVLRKWIADSDKEQVYLNLKSQREKEIAEAELKGSPIPFYSYKLKEPRKKQRVIVEHVDIIKEDFWIREFGLEFLSL